VNDFYEIELDEDDDRWIYTVYFVSNARYHLVATAAKNTQRGAEIEAFTYMASDRLLHETEHAHFIYYVNGELVESIL
jgi:hypothetical protein